MYGIQMSDSIQVVHGEQRQRHGENALLIVENSQLAYGLVN